MYKLPEGEHTLAIEFFPPSTLQKHPYIALAKLDQVIVF